MKRQLLCLLFTLTLAQEQNPCSCLAGQRCLIESDTGCITQKCIPASECHTECSPLSIVLSEKHMCCCDDLSCSSYDSMPHCDGRISRETFTSSSDSQNTSQNTEPIPALEIKDVTEKITSDNIENAPEESKEENFETTEVTTKEPFANTKTPTSSTSETPMSSVISLKPESTTFSITSTTKTPKTAEKAVATAATTTTDSTPKPTEKTTTRQLTTTPEPTTTTTTSTTTSTAATTTAAATTTPSTTTTTTTTKPTTTSIASTPLRLSRPPVTFAPTTTTSVPRTTIRVRTTTYEDDSDELPRYVPGLHQRPSRVFTEPTTTAKSTTPEGIVTSSVRSKDSEERSSALIPWWSAVVLGVVFSAFVGWIVLVCVIKKRRTQRPATNANRRPDKKDQLVDPLLLQKNGEQ